MIYIDSTFTCPACQSPSLWLFRVGPVIVMGCRCGQEFPHILVPLKMVFAHETFLWDHLRN